MKTLSEQICKLCGVEPKEINPEYPFKSTKVYPDFEKPENFVRLFNLEIENVFTLAYFITDKYYNVENTKDFLRMLIMELDAKLDKDVKFIKQAIREAEWEY